MRDHVRVRNKRYYLSVVIELPFYLLPGIDNHNFQGPALWTGELIAVAIHLWRHARLYGHSC